MGKVISPATHAAIDYLLVGSLLLGGTLLWKRNRRAAVAALVAGGSGLGTILGTRFPGGVWDKISFPAHGRISVAHTLAVAAVPMLLGFQRSAPGWFFTVQAGLMAAVDALTDFDERQRDLEGWEPLGIGA
jgi:hypothetical protein